MIISYIVRSSVTGLVDICRLPLHLLFFSPSLVFFGSFKELQSSRPNSASECPALNGAGNPRSPLVSFYFFNLNNIFKNIYIIIIIKRAVNGDNYIHIVIFVRCTIFLLQ